MDRNDELVWFTVQHTIPVALGLLPGVMDTPQARAQLITIGLQESQLTARQQHGTKVAQGHGPAKGLWQFERLGACPEMLEPPCRAYFLPICDRIGYPQMTRDGIHEAIEHNDVLAAVAARLLCWKDPWTMPESTQVWRAYTIYRRRWRPGREHKADWPVNFRDAWEMVRA